MYKLKHWFWNIISCGLPADEDLETLRKVILLNLMFIIGGSFLALLCTVASLQGANLLTAVDLAVFCLLFGLFLYLKKTINHKLVGAIGAVATGLFYFWLVAYGGVSNTAYIWSLTYPLIAVYLLGKKLGSVFSMLLLAMAGMVQKWMGVPKSTSSGFSSLPGSKSAREAFSTFQLFFLRVSAARSARFLVLPELE